VALQDDEDERRWEEGGGKRGGTASVIAGHAACCLPPEASWAGVMLEEPAEAAETEVEGERSGRLWTYGFQRPGGEVVLSRMRRGNTGGSWPLRIVAGIGGSAQWISQGQHGELQPRTARLSSGRRWWWWARQCAADEVGGGFLPLERVQRLGVEITNRRREGGTRRAW
jgi:hypothetical protein